MFLKSDNIHFNVLILDSNIRFLQIFKNTFSEEQSERLFLQKVKLRNRLSLCFWFHIARFFKETLRPWPQIWIFSFVLNIFQVFFKFPNNWIKYLTVGCFFKALFCKVSTKLFSASARISQKWFASSEVHLQKDRFFFIFFCFALFCFKSFFIFSSL